MRIYSMMASYVIGMIVSGCRCLLCYCLRVYAYTCVKYVYVVMYELLLDHQQVFLSKFPERYWPGRFDYIVRRASILCN